MTRRICAGLVLVLAGTLQACREVQSTDVSLVTDNFFHFDPDVSRDGRIAFAKPVEGAGAIFVMDSAGATPRRLTNGVWDFNPRWSPDGAWIAFQRETNVVDVLIVPASGGDPIVVEDGPSNDEHYDWLPDASALLYGKTSGVGTETWIYRLADSSREKLIDAPGSSRGIPSPDGKWVVYDNELEGRRTIWLMNLATKEKKQLTAEGFEELDRSVGTWSGDSRRVVYTSRRSGTADLWVVDVITGENRQLTRDVRTDFGGSYSPSGNRIAFFSDRGGQLDIWVVADTGGVETRVTDDVAAEFDFAWTQDGSALIIVANGEGGRLYSIPFDGGAETTLTSADGDDVNQFDLSPDGSLIVFEQRTGDDVDIFAVPTNGETAPVVVSASPSDDVSAAISPDGLRVAFASERVGNFDIYVVPIGGGTARQLTNWPSREVNPKWSPDGAWIAFLSNRRDARSLWIMDSSGGNTRALAPGINVVGTFKWRADGKSILIEARNAQGDSRLYEVDVASGRARMLGSLPVTSVSYTHNDSNLVVGTIEQGYAHIRVLDRNGQLVRTLSPDDKRYDRNPVVSPDGRHVIFQEYDYDTDYYDIAVVPIEGGTPRRLTQLKGETGRHKFSPDGKTVYYSGRRYDMLFYRRVVR